MRGITKYSDTKISKISWAKNIPSHWHEYKIKHVFRIVKRIVGELGFDVLSITQKGIKVKDTKSGEGQLAMDYSKYQLAEIGDFAMNHMDLLTGFVDISKFHGVISPDYRVFKLEHPQCDCNYMLYLMQLCYTQKIFFGHGKGVSMLGRWRLPAENFKNFMIPVPSKEEQVQIAKFLDFKLAKIDRFIKKKRQLINLNIERRKSLTLQIIKSEPTKYLRLSSVVELIQRPIERDNDMFYTPIGLYNRGRGVFHKPLTMGKDLGDSNFFYVKEGDVILSGQFAWEGAVALANSEDSNCIASHRYPILNCKRDDILPEYLFSFFTTTLGQFLLENNSRGAAGRNRPLNPRTLLKEKIPVPLISLQVQLVEEIKNEASLKNTIESEISLVEEYKTTLISEAVTGKIDVREFQVPDRIDDQDTYDETEEELSIATESEPEYLTEDEY